MQTLLLYSIKIMGIAIYKFKYTGFYNAKLFMNSSLNLNVCSGVVALFHVVGGSSIGTTRGIALV